MEDEGWERFAVLSARLLFEDFILLKRNYSFVGVRRKKAVRSIAF